jgi:hypothetical protein
MKRLSGGLQRQRMSQRAEIKSVPLKPPSLEIFDRTRTTGARHVVASMPRPFNHERSACERNPSA